MAERVSFRQVGKDKPGKLYKGPILDGYNRVSQASIPSKFELILAKQNDSKEGFGRSSNRFETSFSHNPGPGHYPESPKSSSPSYSRKGFLSGFVSGSNRFRSNQYKTSAPGPGAYAPPFQEKPPGNPTSSFIPPKSASKKPLETHPGPGQYEAGPLRKPRAYATTSFKSKTKRSENMVHTEAPPPGYYNPLDKIVRSSSQELTSIFHQPVNARRFQVNLYDPHSQVSDEPTPGPGHYQDSLSFEVPKTQSSYNHQDLDRFGHAVRQKRAKSGNPGPGTYAQETETREKLPVSGAVFMSESVRDGSNPAKAPGPAFYRPAPVPRKKSFHLNAERKWV